MDCPSGRGGKALRLCIVHSMCMYLIKFILMSPLSLPSGVQLGLGPCLRILGGMVWWQSVLRTPTKATRPPHEPPSFWQPAAASKHQAGTSNVSSPKSDFAPIRELASGATLVNTQYLNLSLPVRRCIVPRQQFFSSTHAKPLFVLTAGNSQHTSDLSPPSGNSSLLRCNRFLGSRE